MLGGGSYYKGGGGGTRERTAGGKASGTTVGGPAPAHRRVGAARRVYEQARFGWPAPGALDHVQLTEALAWLVSHVKLTVSPVHVQFTPSDCVKPGRVS